VDGLPASRRQVERLNSAAAAALNDRPHKTLSWRTPTEALDSLRVPRIAFARLGGVIDPCAGGLVASTAFAGSWRP